MNITVLMPFIRVQVFAIVMWALAKLGLPAEQANAVTDWAMVGVAAGLSTAYGAWAASRATKAAKIAAVDAMPDKQVVTITGNPLNR